MASSSKLPLPKFRPTAATASPIRIAFYIPTQTKDGHTDYRGIKHDDLLQVALNFLTFEFGGATHVPATGYYVDPSSKRTQQEPVSIVYSNTTAENVRKHIHVIEELANDLAVRLDQTSVAFEIGDTMYFAAPTPSYREKNKQLHDRLESLPPDEARGWTKYRNLGPLIAARNPKTVDESDIDPSVADLI